MKLHKLSSSTRYLVQGVSVDSVTVNGVVYRSSLAIAPAWLRHPWPVPALENMSMDHVSSLLDPEPPEVVLLGTGRVLRFPDPSFTAAMHARHIGVEAMDTAAACRTYNILVGEERSVVAVLLIGEEGGQAVL